MNIAEIWFYLRKNKLAVTGLVIILVLIIGAVFAPLITPTGYAEQKYLEKINDFPSVHHWFGVDALGRDYYSRVIYGIRISLLVGFSTALLALVIGVPLGALAGYLGGIVDWVVMRLVETFSVIPPPPYSNFICHSIRKWIRKYHLYFSYGKLDGCVPLGKRRNPYSEGKRICGCC
jgi:ABC-type dipeptide/oligopeptide/nickel transport system permease subunit